MAIVSSLLSSSLFVYFATKFIKKFLFVLKIYFKTSIYEY